MKTKRQTKRNAWLRAMFFSAMCTISFLLKSQIPSGFWQQGNNSVSATSRAGYRFSTPNKFQYFRNGFEQTNPLLNFGGSYEVGDSTIVLTINYYTILQDFTITDCLYSAIDKGWSLEGGESVKKLFGPERVVLPFVMGADSLKIGAGWYFLLEKDLGPDSYLISDRRDSSPIPDLENHVD